MLVWGGGVRKCIRLYTPHYRKHNDMSLFSVFYFHFFYIHNVQGQNAMMPAAPSHNCQLAYASLFVLRLVYSCWT